MSPLGAPRRVLFVGDSLTYANDLDEQVAQLARAADPVDGGTLQLERAVRGGAPLKSLWKKTDARQRIARGAFDAVVLQEDLPETSVETFHEYAGRFHEHIRAASSEAQTVLLMTWPYKRLDWIWTDGIAEEHWKAAARLGARVAAAGLAWERCGASHPEIGLYDEDEEHPSVSGSYLAACVVFATLWGRSPEGLRYAPSGVSDGARPVLQRIAWETVEACRGKAAASAASPATPAEASTGRGDLVAVAFAALDLKEDGRLDAAEMAAFAKFMDFDWGAEAWAREFETLCGEVGVATDDGVDLENFRRLVDEGNHNALMSKDLTDDELRELAVVCRQASPGQGGPTPRDGLGDAPSGSPDRVVIVPGNGDGSVWDANWYGWLATELQRRGVTVGMHDMPDPIYAREKKWLPFIEEQLAGGRELLPRTIVVGHSSGAAAAMRLAEKRKLGGMVLVAAYTSDLDDPTERKSGYFNRPWQWESQRENCGFIVQFASTDDPFLPIEEQREVRDGLAPTVQYLEFDGRSHFFHAPFWELLDVLRQRLGLPSRDPS